MWPIRSTNVKQKRINRRDNDAAEGKAKPGKPFVPCPKHVAVDCGDKAGARRVVLAPVAAVGFAGFPGLYV